MYRISMPASNHMWYMGKPKGMGSRGPGKTRHLLSKSRASALLKGSHKGTALGAVSASPRDQALRAPLVITIHDTTLRNDGRRPMVALSWRCFTHESFPERSLLLLLWISRLILTFQRLGGLGIERSRLPVH